MSDFISLRGGFLLLPTGILIFQTLRNPKFGVIAFMILLFSRDAFLMAWFSPAYETLHLPLVFGTLTLISCFLHSKEYPFQRPFQLWLMLAFFVVICTSRFLSGTGIFNHKVPNEFLKMCVLFFLITNTIRREEDVRQAIYAIITVSVFSVLYHYYHYRIGTSWRSIFVTPEVGALNRNGFAATLASACPLAYFSLKGSKNTRVKVLLGFSLFSFVVGVILTYSRGGFLALAIAFTAVTLLDKERAKVVLVILILGIVIFPRLSHKYTDRISSIKDYKEDVSAMGRVATNEAAINMIKAQPLFGIGAGNYNYVFLDYMPPHLRKWVRPGKSIHNIILQVGSENGFIGLTIFLCLIIGSLIDVIRVRRLCLRREQTGALYYMATALGIALFVYFMAMQFGQGAYYSYIYIFLPLIVAAKQILRSEVSAEEEGVESKELPCNPNDLALKPSKG